MCYGMYVTHKVGGKVGVGGGFVNEVLSQRRGGGVIASEVCQIPTFAPGWGRWGKELIGALSLNQQSYSHGTWFIARAINRDYLQAAAL